MKNINIQIVILILTFTFSALNLIASDEPSLTMYKTKTSGIQYELCWLPGEKPTGTLHLNGASIITKGSVDCLKTTVVTATAPYSFEIAGKVFKYSAGGGYVSTNPVKLSASKAGLFAHTLTFGANELPAAGLSTISINGTAYTATKLSATAYRVSSVPSATGRMVVKAAGKTFIYESQTSNVVVQRAAPKARIMAAGDVELEWQPNEIPENLAKVKIAGIDYPGTVTGTKFLTTAKTFTAQLSKKLVMNMKGATRSFSMATIPGADATLLARDNPTTKLSNKLSPDCGNMELTWIDPLEVPLNLKSVEINGTNYIGTVTGGKFTTTEQVSCAIDGDYPITLRDYAAPVTHSEILPIQLSEFNVKYNHRELVTIVDWTIQSSENVSRYEIHRSFDGENFEPIHGIRSDGYTGTKTYQFLDETVPFKYSGWVYYRLRNIDTDGSFQDHMVAAVNFKGRSVTDNEISIFPNPAKSFININTTEKGSLLIFSQLGKLVLETEIEAGTSKIDLIDLSSGVYFGKFVSQYNTQETFKIQIAQ